MVSALAWVTVTACLVLAGWALVGAVRGSRPSGPQLAALVGTEAVLVVQALVGAVQLARTDQDVGAVTFAGYLVASVVLLPAGVLWGIADRSRWGNGVIAVACVACVVVVLRMLQVWS
ncbi:hypothetical protein [Thalassiella azotivora]